MKNVKTNVTATNNEVEQKLEQAEAVFKVLTVSDTILSQLPESYQIAVQVMRAVHGGGSYCGYHIKEEIVGAPSFRVVAAGIPQLCFQQFASEEEARQAAEELLPPTIFRKIYEDDSNKRFTIIDETTGAPADGILYENRDEATVRLISIANPELMAELGADRVRED